MPDKLYTKPTEDGKAKFIQVESQSSKGKYYTLRVMPDGEMRCSCTANVYGNVCNHIKKYMGIPIEEKKKHNKKDSLHDVIPF